MTQGRIILVLWLLMWSYALRVYSDVPTLHRHAEPPTATLSCADELRTIRGGLVNVSIQESILWNDHDQQTSDFYLRRAAEARRTRDLNVNYANCLTRNRMELNLIWASWQYQYEHDKEILQHKETP